MQKTLSDAELIAQKHNIDPALAHQITKHLWAEAGKIILKQVSAEEWKSLSVKDRATVCTEVVKKLMDEKWIQDVLNKKRLLF
jgi:hypothetical protein